MGALQAVVAPVVVGRVRQLAKLRFLWTQGLAKKRFQPVKGGGARLRVVLRKMQHSRDWCENVQYWVEGRGGEWI